MKIMKNIFFKVISLILILSVFSSAFADKMFYPLPSNQPESSNENSFLKKEMADDAPLADEITPEKVIFFLVGGITLVTLEALFGYTQDNTIARSSSPYVLYYLAGMLLAIPLLTALTSYFIYLAKNHSVKKQTNNDLDLAEKEAKSISRFFCGGAGYCLAWETVLFTDFIILLVVIFVLFPIQL